MKSNSALRVAVVLITVTTFFGSTGKAGQSAPVSARARPPKLVRLYVFDCGTLHIADIGRFRLKKEDVPITDLSVACFLVAHPKGTLIWDPGAVADSAWTPTATPVRYHVVLPDAQERYVTMRQPLKPQLAAIGYAPSDITYLALSHYHYDHTANANEFTGATWLVQQAERDAMFAEKPPGTALPSSYAALRNRKTLILKNDEHDVFADGSVVIKLAPGHTPGHQILYVKLAKTGGIVLSGDTYHYPQMRDRGLVTTFEFNPEQSRSTRAAVEGFLKKTGATLWIQHDFASNSKLKKAPEYYE